MAKRGSVLDQYMAVAGGNDVVEAGVGNARRGETVRGGGVAPGRHGGCAGRGLLGECCGDAGIVGKGDIERISRGLEGIEIAVAAMPGTLAVMAGIAPVVAGAGVAFGASDLGGDIGDALAGDVERAAGDDAGSCRCSGQWRHQASCCCPESSWLGMELSTLAVLRLVGFEKKAVNGERAGVSTGPGRPVSASG